MFPPLPSMMDDQQLQRSTPSLQQQQQQQQLPFSPQSPPRRSNKPGTQHGKSNKEENLKLVPCKFFKNGACTAGKNCMFSHNPELFQSRAVCKYFLKGNCKFGSKCALAHVFPAGDRAATAKQQFSNNAMGIPRQAQQQQQQQHSQHMFQNGVNIGASPPALGSPPSFQHFQGNRGVLLSMSYDSDHFGSSPGVRSLGRISEEQRKQRDDQLDYDDTDEGDAFKFEEDFLPSSLNELLTPDELDRRRTRQEDHPFADPLAARMKSLGGGVASAPRDDMLFPSRLHSRMSWTGGALGGISGGIGGETGSLPGGLNGYYSPLSTASVPEGAAAASPPTESLPPAFVERPTAISIPSLQYRKSQLSEALAKGEQQAQSQSQSQASPSLHATFQSQPSQHVDDDGEMPFVMEDEAA